MTTHDLTSHLHTLLTAECEAESHATEADAADLRQAVWLRWLEYTYAAGPPAAPAEWLRAAVRAEVRRELRRSRLEIPLTDQEGGLPHTVSTDAAPGAVAHRRVTAVDGHGDPASASEAPLLAGERRRALRAAIGRLPGRCPEVMAALLLDGDRTYREIAGELGISQGSLGPVRSRCLGCLRRMLSAGVAAPELRGMVR